MAYGHEPQEQAAEFHRALDMPIGDTPELRRKNLRLGLISEECQELVEALEGDDLVGAIDALCDLIYVIYGAALEWGLDLKPFYDEVHRSNMTKVGGAKRADGKQLKPPTYTPPDLASILRAQIADAQPQGNYNSIIGRSAVGGLS